MKIKQDAHPLASLSKLETEIQHHVEIFMFCNIPYVMPSSPSLHFLLLQQLEDDFNFTEM